MAKKKHTKSRPQQSDGVFLLKVVLYIILGSLWLRFADPVHLGAVTFTGLPIGLFIGLLLASHDHFQVDRKIEYVLLIIATMLSYFLPTGIVL